MTFSTLQNYLIHSRTNIFTCTLEQRSREYLCWYNKRRYRTRIDKIDWKWVGFSASSRISWTALYVSSVLSRERFRCSINSISHPNPDIQFAEYNLTYKQHEALSLAYTEGYFDKPRRTTLEALGESLGITQEAVLARLQNGEKNILENTIVHSINSEFNP